MAKPPDSTSKDDDELKITLSTTTCLVEKFQSALTKIPESQEIESSITDPLQVLETAASLIRAHAVKLTLLATNKPFTPSAICKVLREASTVALPTIMAARETIQPDLWTGSFVKEVSHRIGRLLEGFRNLLALIPHQVSAMAQKVPGKVGNESRDVMMSTGILWEACDALQSIKKQGLAGILVKKATEWQDTVKDAIEELKDWQEEGEDDNEEGEDDSGVFSDEKEDIYDDIDQAFKAEKLPQDATELREHLANCLGKLRLIQSLFTAVIKRRLKTAQTPEFSAVNKNQDYSRLEVTIQQLSLIPDEVDEVAARFYQHDSDGAKIYLSKCIGHARTACESIRLTPQGKPDIFTEWSDKWAEIIDANG
ncbi:MAG: hypothetical protein M1814_003395 [Vezdaea aestivalis]|nr:MAG: hypothetical protein M1814_003395 [Vezdaea aestivalis]